MSARHKQRSRPRVSVVAAGIGLGIFAATFVLRSVFLSRSYDIFVDEVTYYRLATNLLEGHGLNLFGVPFFLHPPLFFLIEALYISIIRPAGDLVQQVEATRLLNVILAGVSAVAILGIVSRTAGRNIGVAAAILFALEPFVNRVNSRLLLETMVLTWVVLGYYVLLVAGLADSTQMDDGAGRRGSPADPRSRRNLDYVVGILFGLAMLSKDVAIFVTLLPIMMCAVTGKILERRRAATIAVVAIGAYALYPLGVTLAGLGSDFTGQKLRGLLRFLGIARETGFDRGAGGPSFLSAVFSNLDVFAVTYFLMAIGVLAVIGLMRWGGATQRLIGLWTACSYLLLGYSLALGTLEEHFFYLLVVPAIIATASAWPIVVEAAGRHFAPPRSAIGPLKRVLDQFTEVLPRFGAIALIAALGWGGLVWIETRSTTDDSYSRLIGYLDRNVPDGRVLGVTHPLEGFILHGYVLQQISSVADIAQKRIDYVVISTKQVQDGYTADGRAILGWLQSNGELQTSFTGRSYGSLELWMIKAPPASLRGDAVLPFAGRSSP